MCITRHLNNYWKNARGAVDTERACVSILPFELISDKEYVVQNGIRFQYIQHCCWKGSFGCVPR